MLVTVVGVISLWRTNDASLGVVTLFRIVQRHPAALLEELSGRVMSRAEFERLA